MDDHLSVEGVDEPITRDRLAGEWKIHQLKRGHRFSVDDVLAAWAGVESQPNATRLLDLGAGIGSVGLLALWRMEEVARLVMVEAQEVSHRLARATIRWNELEDRIEARLGDLRDPESVPEHEHFDLITCSPPYIPVGKGVISPHPQRAGARMELRGSIFDYCATARRALARNGRVSLVFAAGDPRGEEALSDAGLALVWRRDVVFREGQPPTITLLVGAHEGAEGLSEPERKAPLYIRQADGRFTEEIWALRQAMGTKLAHRGHESPASKAKA